MSDKALFPQLNYRMFRATAPLTIEKNYRQVKGIQSHRLDGTSIRILCWNIARTNHSEGWTADCQYIFERYRPNLVFFQEVKLCEQAKTIPDLSHLGWCFAPNFSNLWNKTYSGVLIAADAEHVEAEAMITSHTEPLINTPKVSLVAKFTLDGLDGSAANAQTLLVLNVHAINFVSLAKFSQQIQDIEQQIIGHTGPVILAGDFNTWSSGRLNVLREMTVRQNLDKVSFNPSDDRKLMRVLLSPPLDHIFYRGVTQISGSATVIDTLSSSDHNPLLVELSI